jgi:hypothetical protein
MSKRHQSSRRKSYGRRQHEVRQRHEGATYPDAASFELDEWGAAAPSDPLAFLDPRAPRFRLAPGD